MSQTEFYHWSTAIEKTFRQKFAANPLVRFLIAEPLIIFLILLNTAVLFLDEFPEIHQATNGKLLIIDYACILYFILEAAIKIIAQGFNGYWKSAWNRFDFIIVVASLPTLLAPILDVQVFSIVLVLRMGRLFRFFRVLRFIPNAEHLLVGIVRSLKASVGVFITLFILLLVFSMGATILFGKIAPEYFGNPLLSLYALFKVFTVEGWFEIPDQLAENGVSGTDIFMLRGYFIAAVTLGGVLGLSLANAVFVDEMTADNTDKVEKMVENLQDEMARFHDKARQDNLEMLAKIQQDLDTLRQQMTDLAGRNRS